MLHVGTTTEATFAIGYRTLNMVGDCQTWQLPHVVLIKAMSTYIGKMAWNLSMDAVYGIIVKVLSPSRVKIDTGEILYMDRIRIRDLYTPSPSGKKNPNKEYRLGRHALGCEELMHAESCLYSLWCHATGVTWHFKDPNVSSFGVSLLPSLGEHKTPKDTGQIK